VLVVGAEVSGVFLPSLALLCISSTT